ncbi:MAG: maleylpyruvate isomerase family mycothiol-dependent enzyme [Actinobacteria bacterium]|nr:maleylpyruvate isomerase family mycothiol-dependent enzyme [Actinomycetota bacterium]MBO0786698.1 maleylpyruvate isomerase family mycothiol-dependent enzyme [Actinomycetota bacterium]
MARLCAETRQRITSLVSGLAGTELSAPVPACPAWSVRDVLAHLAATAEDVQAGRMTGIPTDEETAAQVARFAGRDLPGILAAWAAAAPAFEQAIAGFRVWPGVIDLASHEQDIRGALGRPGARDNEAVWHAAGRLLAGLRPPVPVRVVVEDAEFLAGPADGTGAAPALQLTTSRFEAFRWRMGRRSRAQLAALDWSGDPAAVLDHLVVFGPAAADVVE